MQQVLLITPTLRRGGAEHVVARLSKHWEAEGKSIVVATFDASNPAYEFGGSVVDLKFPPQSGIAGKFRQIFRRRDALAELMSNNRITNAIGFMETANIPLVLASRRASTSLHTTVSIRSSISAIPWWQRILMRWLYPFADRVATQNYAMKNQAIKLLNLPEVKCAIINNPLGEDILGIPAVPFNQRDSSLVLSYGRLGPEKGFDLLLKAFAPIHNSFQFKLLILGEGIERSALPSLRDNLNLQMAVDFPGATSNVGNWLDRCGMFIMSSRYEGFPNSLAEAMGRGCPIVSFACQTGPSEMLTHGKTGLLVPPGDVEGLTTAMKSLAVDRNFAAQLGIEARKHAMRWHIKHIAPRWLDV